MFPYFGCHHVPLSVFIPLIVGIHAFSTLSAATSDVGLTCGTEFDDIGSRALRASIVLEARPTAILQTAGDGDRRSRFVVSFVVLKLYKGNLADSHFRKSSSSSSPASAASSADASAEPIKVGFFSESAEPSSCVAPLPPYGSRKQPPYLVFLEPAAAATSVAVVEPTVGEARATKSNRTSSGSRNATHKHRPALPVASTVVYRISAFPIPVSKRAVTEVLEYTNCSKCGKPPAVSLDVVPGQPSTGNQSTAHFVVGKPMELVCRVRRGRPIPSSIQWLRDGQPLVSDGRVRLMYQKSGSKPSSKVRIKKTTQEDSGQYQCFAVNVVGRSEKATIMVTVQSGFSTVTPASKPHSELCSQQLYCLNGGTCFVQQALGRRYCECTPAFQGDRCHEKSIPPEPAVRPIHEFSFDKLLQDHPIVVPAAIVVIGSLIVVMLSIMIYACCSTRRKRQLSSRHNGRARYDEVPIRPDSPLAILHSSVNSANRSQRPTDTNNNSNGISRQPDTVNVVQSNGRVPAAVIRLSAASTQSPSSNLSRPVSIPEATSPTGRSRNRLRASSMTPDSKELLDTGELRDGSNAETLDIRGSTFIGGGDMESINLSAAATAAPKRLSGQMFFAT